MVLDDPHPTQGAIGLDRDQQADGPRITIRDHGGEDDRDRLAGLAHPIDLGAGGAQQVRGTDLDAVLEGVVVHQRGAAHRLGGEDGPELGQHGLALVGGDPLGGQGIGEHHQADASDGEGAEDAPGDENGLVYHVCSLRPWPKTRGWV